MLKKLIRSAIKYVTSPAYRMAIHTKLGAYNNVSDEEYLKRKYRLLMGQELNLHDPHTFNEKLQWLKLHDRRLEYTTMVDKYEVKKYIAETIGEEYVIPTLGVWDHFEDIDFNTLPNQFVLKCTHDSGGLVICRDKKNFDYAAAKKKIQRCLKQNYYYKHREWPYKNVIPRVMAERYMEDENKTEGLRDYKFFCFHNIPKFLYVSEGLEDHSTAGISFYDFDGKEMPFRRSDFRTIGVDVQLPGNFPEMREIARILSEMVGSPFVRIDLYSINGRIYFSEITFYPCAGMVPFEPKEWDHTLGSWIDLSSCEQKRL